MKIQSIGFDNVNSRNIQKSQPTFGREWGEHISWGANYIKKTGKTNFKLFSFPDAKAVLLEITQNAALKLTNWWEHTVKVKNPKELATATTAAAIASISTIDKDSKLIPMPHKGEGVYELEGVDVKPGD